MHAVTIRRLIVFGVCAFGVGCLYLVPSVARSPDSVRRGGTEDQPISAPSTTVKPAAVQSTGHAVPQKSEIGAAGQQSAATATEPTKINRSGSAFHKDTTAQIETRSERDTASSRDDATSGNESTQQPEPTANGATAVDPHDTTSDDTPPDPVRGIKLGPMTHDELTIRWMAAPDDNGVVGYRVWLDGFLVATTSDTRVKVNWFNDDMSQHVVQVKALDAAGNQSSTSEILLAIRPTPGPKATPTPSPSSQPSTTASPEPTEPQ